MLFGKSENEVRGRRNEPLPVPNEGLPDSYRPNGLCPRCGKQSSFEIIGSLPVTFNGSYCTEKGDKRFADYDDRVSCLVCRNCNQGLVVIEEKWIGEQPVRLGLTGGGIQSFRGIHWWPLPESSLSADIPEEIASVFREATTSLLANCPRASAVMSRRALEAITENMGETNGPLAQRLSRLAEKGLLHPTLSDWAKEIRLIGNEGAHFDPANQVTYADAQQLVNFMRELLKFVYELPAELNRRRNP